MQALFAVEGNRIRCWRGLDPLWLKIVQMNCVILVDERVPPAASAVSVKRVRRTPSAWVGTNENILVDLTDIYAMGWVRRVLGSLRKEEGREQAQHPYWSCLLAFIEGLKIPRQPRVVTVQLRA